MALRRGSGDVPARGGRPRRPLTPARARRLVGLGSAVAPLLAPYALAAAGAVRSRWDAHRAAALGVTPDRLASYAGRGGQLHARLSRVAEALATLEGGSPGARGFAIELRSRLPVLAVAVRAAEQMPPARRRVAFRSVAAELDRIEADLLAHLGVGT